MRGDDPLAELARIVNREKPRDDSFDDLFRDARGDATDPRFASAASGSGRGPRRAEPEDEFDFPGAYGSPQTSSDDDYYNDAGYDTAGARAEWDDAGDPDDGYPVDDEEENRRQAGRGLWAIGAVVGFVILAGSLAYAWRSGLFATATLPGSGGNAPVISASKEPTKVEAQPTVSPTPPAASTEGEQVVAREEQPVELGAPQPGSTDAPRVILPAPNGAAPPADGAAVAPVEPAAPVVSETPAAEPQPAPAATPTRQEPRRVRTVKVLADGTIVTGEAPAPPTGVPSLAGQAANDSLAASADATTATTAPVASGSTTVEPLTSRAVPINDPPKIEEQVASVTEEAVLDPATAEAAADAAAGEPIPLPPPRPAVPQRTAAAEPVDQFGSQPLADAAPPVESAPPAAAETSGSAGGGGFVVQIASAKSEGDAQASLRGLQRRFADVIGNQPANIRRVEIPGKGTFFRVRLGPLSSRDDAVTLCTQLKAAGGDCVVAKS
jgi:hypothetical protein